MRWKIREFVFEPSARTLTTETRQLELEPLVAEVLDYFCQHPNTIISRNMLIEDVWNMRIVTDNAVNRIIAQLRKALGDDPKSPRFIATFPRKGYEFVADVSLLKEPESISLIENTPSRWMGVLVTIVVIFIAMIFFGFSLMHHGQSEHGALAVDFLTRDAGQELFPALSPDGRYLVYSRSSVNGLQLLMKDLQTRVTIPVGPTEGYSGPAHWSDDQTRFVYLYTSGKDCEYRIAYLKEGIISNEKTVYYCSPNSYGKAIFSHDGTKLIFTEATTAGPPYSIFELDLESSSVRRLSQPQLVLGGNSQFDLHPVKDVLLITSPDAAQRLAFYELNLGTDRLTHLFNLDEYMCCAIWGTDGERIVLISEHPSYQLISFDQEGGDRHVIHQAPHRISAPARLKNEQGYVFVGDDSNRDILSCELDGSSLSGLITSSVIDRLPRVSSDGKHLVYVSERTGQEDIWLYDLTTREDTRLTRFNSNSRYFDLQWSPDGKSIAAMTINSVWLIDVASGEESKIPIPPMEIRGLSWKTSQTVSFSLPIAGRWQAHSYTVGEASIKSNPEPWAYINYRPVLEETYWVADNGTIFYGADQAKLSLSEVSPLIDRRFNLKLFGVKAYYMGMDSDGWTLRSSVLMTTDEVVSENTTLVSLNGPTSFSVRNGQLYVEKTVSISSDIYRLQKTN